MILEIVATVEQEPEIEKLIQQTSFFFKKEIWDRHGNPIFKISIDSDKIYEVERVMTLANKMGIIGIPLGFAKV